jgi:hypothetical protein
MHLSERIEPAVWIPQEYVPCRQHPQAWATEFRGTTFIKNTCVKICREECPFVDECFDSAMKEEAGLRARHRIGIRGGLTPLQRYRIDKRENPSRSFD